MRSCRACTAREGCGKAWLDGVDVERLVVEVSFALVLGLFCLLTFDKEREDRGCQSAQHCACTCQNKDTSPAPWVINANDRLIKIVLCGKKEKDGVWPLVASSAINHDEDVSAH